MIRLRVYSILVCVWGSSCATSGAFVHVKGDFWAHLGISKSNRLDAVIFRFFFIHLGHTPQILLRWLLRCWTSTGSCVIGGAFEHVCKEIFGHIMALFVSHACSHQVHHRSIMSQTTLTSLLSCIHVSTTNLLNIKCTLVVTCVILKRLECTWISFWL